jgi:hypothetical protein
VAGNLLRPLHARAIKLSPMGSTRSLAEGEIAGRATGFARRRGRDWLGRGAERFDWSRVSTQMGAPFAPTLANRDS